MADLHRIRALYLACGISLMLASWLCWNLLNLWQNELSWIVLIFGSVFIGVSVIGFSICFHISVHRISAHHTMLSTIAMYVIFHMLKFKCLLVHKKLRDAWRHPRRYQERALQEILGENADTECGLKYGFSDVKDMSDFCRRHPVTDYSHYKDDISRMTNGERNVLLKNNPYRYVRTSGTAGEAKLLPISRTMSDLMLLYEVLLPMMIRLAVFPDSSALCKGMFLYTHCSMGKTPDGAALQGPISCIQPEWRKLVSLVFSSPPPGFTIQDPNAAAYVHMVFALKDPHLSFLYPIFSTQLYFAFRKLEHDWTSMVDDIKRGKLKSDLELPEETRKELEAYLEPDEDRATELRREFKEGFHAIIRRLWPSAVLVMCDNAGYDTLLGQGYGHGSPIYAYSYGATEGMFGLNIWPTSGKGHYVLLPMEIVMEFIHEVDMHMDNPDTLFMDKLQVGQIYELIVTTPCGLSRFRIGDVVKVVGYHLKCPIVEFQYRSGLVLNVRSEKVDSVVVNKVMHEVVSDWTDVTMVDYAVAESSKLPEDTTAESPFYLIFIELQGAGKDNLTEYDLKQVDVIFRKHSYTYGYMREKRLIAEPRVYVTPSGTFARLREFVVETTTVSPNQLKNLRTLRTSAMVEFMMTCVNE